MPKLYQSIGFQAVLENINLVGALYSVGSLAREAGDIVTEGNLVGMAADFVGSLVGEMPERPAPVPEVAIPGMDAFLTVLDTSLTNTVHGIAKHSGMPIPEIQKLVRRGLKQGCVMREGKGRGTCYYRSEN